MGERLRAALSAIESGEAVRFGFYLVSAEDVIFSPMGGFHPSWAPDYQELGDPANPDTWAEAYHLKSDLEAALKEVRDDAQYEFGEMGEDGKVVEDYEAGIHPAAVTSDGTLIIAREAALMLLTRAGSDSPATLLRAAGDDVVVFTRDEVYASIGASPEFLHAGFSH